MAKTSSIFVCQNCNAQYSKWMGNCSECGEWNSMVESVVESSKKSSFSGKKSVSRTVSLSKVKIQRGSKGRVTTGMGEFDRVLGGGVLPGSVVLIAGHPGIGKSTLLTQLSMIVGKNKVAKRGRPVKEDGKKVLYVCGEESPEQVKLRSERIVDKNINDIQLLSDVNVDTICSTIDSLSDLSLVIVDSIQSIFTEDLSGMAGSVGQVRESTNRLIRIAKRKQVPVFLVGHVTKEGSIAGPKVLEHMVDVVLEITGERTGAFRILRTIKNRFGATDEVGVFEMSDGGMNEVTNPSKAFLEESQTGTPGSVVVAVMEGTRPVLIEVQALVVPSQLAVPRRVSRGVPVNKIQLLSAVLQKRCNLGGLGTSDIFVNVAGGMSLVEPAADLGVALAIASSLKGKALPTKTVVFGEVGLLGEVRKVSYLEKRTKEARKLGYTNVISPEKHRNLRQVVGGVLK
ncbi:DNA repair protein RadA [Patescibacteria group bacterium]